MFKSNHPTVLFKVSRFFSKRKMVSRTMLITVTLLFAALGNAISEQIQTRITPDDGSEGDLFGSDVSIFGDYCVVGAAYEDNKKGIDAGAVYVFRRDGRSWIQETKLLAIPGP